MADMRIAVVMTVFNRRAMTLACLEALRTQQVPDGTVDVFVVDDGSTDGTAQAVVQHHPDVRLLHGDGQLYWNGGMRLALAEAMEGDYDYYLWINDDTRLDDDGVRLCFCDRAAAPREWARPRHRGRHDPASGDRRTHLRWSGPPLPPAQAEMEPRAAGLRTTPVRDDEREHRPGPSCGGPADRQHRPRLCPADG